jgi:Rieske Fe-S protein
MSAVIAAPALGYVLAPSFETERTYEVDLGPTSLYPVDKANPFHVVTFTRKPNGDPDIDRRVVFVRNDGNDAFTAISNTCMHLGCPVRVFGSSGFGCPCHGGQYDAEGRRIAGPPVRPLNRYATKVEKGNLILGELYAMDDSLHRHQLKAPGQPVTGLLSFLYPPAPQ